MIESSAEYKKAITADSRRIRLKAVVDITDPDITYGAAGADSENAYSKSAQLYDRVFERDKFATLERNRWALDGTWDILPDDPAALSGNIGFVGDNLSDSDGAFSPSAWVQLNFSNVETLQALSIYFSDIPEDGIGVDFTVEVLSGGVSMYTKTYKGNSERVVACEGFTVNSPTAIRVTASKWSVGNRRLRIVEIVAGVYELWDEGIIASMSLKQQADMSCTTLSYGTCTLRMDNTDRRFEPRKKSGLFQSIEERQAIPVHIGVDLPTGVVEWKQVGVYYQYSGGWKTGDNGLTMQWELVDIVGLLADRAFISPDELPTTLEGWAAALAAQLGANFSNRFTVDPDYADRLLIADAEHINGINCGDMLRHMCMATGTFPRADAETGFLAIEPLWSRGNKIDLDNLNQYPTMRSNEDIAAIIFTLADSESTRFVVMGNSSAASGTVSVQNPFISTAEQALVAARQILSTYGGNCIELTGRGDPSSEIGDLPVVWLDKSTATTGRIIAQDLSHSGGVLQACRSTLLRADGAFLFEEREIITESGTWTVPEGVTTIRIILVGGGYGGGDGEHGNTYVADVPYSSAEPHDPQNGADGAGGKVFAATIECGAGQTFVVTIGAAETATTFGAYSSANGESIPEGYTDILDGSVYGRSGVAAPLPGSGDGGKGGRAGQREISHEIFNTYYDSDGNTVGHGNDWIIDSPATPGEEGADGASGCVIVYYERRRSTPS